MAISPSSAFVPTLVQLPGEIRPLIRARRLRTRLHLALLLHLLALIHLLLTPLVLPLLIHLLALLLALLGLPLLLHGALLLHELLVLALALLLHLTLLLIKHAPLLLFPLLIEAPLLFLLLLHSPGLRRSTVSHLRRAAVLESGLRAVAAYLLAGVRNRWSVLIRAEIPRAALRTLSPWKVGPHGARAAIVVESWVARARHAGPVGSRWWW